MFPNETKRQTTKFWQRNETHRERNEPIGNETDVAASRNDWRVESKRNVSNTKRNPSETKRNETKSPQAGQLIPCRRPALVHKWLLLQTSHYYCTQWVEFLPALRHRLSKRERLRLIGCQTTA